MYPQQNGGLPGFVTPFVSPSMTGFGGMGSGISSFAPGAPAMSSMIPSPAVASMPSVGGVTPPVSAPGIGGSQPGWLGIEGLGKNVGTLNMGLSGLETIGKLWAAFEAQKLAKAQFSFQKEFANTNLNNQIKSYNTALTDRANTRAIVNGQTEADRDAYIAANRAGRG